MHIKIIFTLLFFATNNFSQILPENIARKIDPVGTFFSANTGRIAEVVKNIVHPLSPATVFDYSNFDLTEINNEQLNDSAKEDFFSPQENQTKKILDFKKEPNISEIIEEIDDISEKIDILKYEVENLQNDKKETDIGPVNESKIMPALGPKSSPLPATSPLASPQPEPSPSPSPSPLPSLSPSPHLLSSPSPSPSLAPLFNPSPSPVPIISPLASSIPPETYLHKVLISEAAAGWTSSENEFIEIYNPNNFSVSLTQDNFELILVNSNNSQTIKRISGLGKAIPAKGYFLLVAGDISILADAVFSDQLTDASGIIIKDGDGNVKDRVAWGKPSKSPPVLAVETQGIIFDQGLQTNKSLERKKDSSNELIDFGDNSQDFFLQTNPNPANSKGETIGLPQPSPSPSVAPSPSPSPSATPIPEATQESTPLPSPSPSPSSEPEPTPSLDATPSPSPSPSISPSPEASPSPSPTIYPKIIINEIMYNPNPGSDSYCEYVELFNTSASNVDVAGWEFKKGETTSKIISADTSSGGASTVIKSNGFAVLADTPPNIYNLEKNCSYSIPDFSENAIRLKVNGSLSLSNAETTISLLKNASEQVDGINYLPSWGGNNNGKSLERVSPYAPTSQMQSGFENWKESINFGGTPGIQNSVFNIDLPVYETASAPADGAP